ncbi:MAG: PEP-CTERM sorting domain-containing protein [Phormidesmis sp. CAN_BIN44]|nr:PEP-CTERM sorting domain-containing protein [Phormidesmis sp. CAN_BIN44]
MKFDGSQWFTRLNRFLAGSLVTAAVVGSASIAQAVTFRFDADPFAGSTALTTPGRQVVGNDLFIPNFSIAEDKFSFDPKTFKVGDLSFFNGLAAALPSGGSNAVVLQNSDNDNNSATPFGAGTAANLIAGAIDAPGAGFFVYFNSVLNLNRLVYSTDLGDPTADLKILARITNPTGQGAIATLPQFTKSNFEVVAVPEPSLLGGIGLTLAMLGARKSRLNRRAKKEACAVIKSSV